MGSFLENVFLVLLKLVNRLVFLLRGYLFLLFYITFLQP